MCDLERPVPWVITSCAAAAAVAGDMPWCSYNSASSSGLGDRVVLELAPLDGHLALDQLVLRGDADPLAGGHARPAGDRAGEAGEAHDRRADAGAAMPMISETLLTSPSLIPNTAARASPPATRRWSWCRSAGCGAADCLHPRAR